MEELQGTLRQAQCAVLQAQQDLIALRRMRDAPQVDDGTDGHLGLQLSSQAKQEEALRHLERGTHLLCGLLKERGVESAPQEESGVDAARQAMRRYFEGQLDVQQRREEKFQQQLTVKDIQIAAAQDAAVTFFQSAVARRLRMRALNQWIRRALCARADRQRAESGRRFRRSCGAIACRYAMIRSGRELQARCFYRWRAKRLEAALKVQRCRQLELEAELQCAQHELQRAELDFQQHVSLNRAHERRVHNAISRVEEEREEVVTRLKTSMGEMSREFSERTSNYLRQQEELARYYAERERRLTQYVMTAEETSHKEEQRAAELATVLRVQQASFDSMMHVAWSAVDICASAKIHLLHRASLALVCDAVKCNAELTEKLKGLTRQVDLFAPLSQQVVVLQRRCEDAERHREATRAALTSQEASLRCRAATAATLLHRAHVAGQTWRIWNSWQLHVVNRRLALVVQTSHVALKEVKKEMWRTAVEWRERRYCTALTQLLQDEFFVRRCVTELEGAARQSLRYKAERKMTESRMRAELLAGERQCVWLWEDVARLTAHVERWKQAAKDIHLTQLLSEHTAHLERIVAMEDAKRISLQYEEFCEQQELQQGFHAVCIAATFHEEKQAMLVELESATGQLQDIGCLLVEYCARNAFGRWLLFAHRKKERRARKQMAAIAGVAVSWLDSSTGLMTRVQDAKLHMLLFHMHQRTAWFVMAAELSAAEAAATRSEMENIHAQRNKQFFKEMKRYGTLCTAITENAANWCAGRECLWLEFCQEVCRAAAVPIKQAKRLLSTERSLMAEHVRVFVDNMHSITTDALEAQKERHETLLEELLQYQTFLESRIATAGVVEDVVEQKNVREEREAYEARIRREMAEMTGCVESLRAELRESNVRRGEERRSHEEEMCVLRSRLREQEEAAQQATARMRSKHKHEMTELRAEMDNLRKMSVERRDAVDGIVRQYERVLLSFQEELVGRRSAFLTAAEMLRDVERFSEELLHRSEMNLRQLLETRQHVDVRLRGGALMAEELNELQKVHESEKAALMGALRNTQEQSEKACRQLREEREAYEARIRREMAEMTGRVESLRAELRESNVRRGEERRSHEEEMCVLRSRLREQEEAAQQATARMRSKHKHEMTELRAEMDNLRKMSVERRDAEQGVPSYHEKQQQQQTHTLQLEGKCYNCCLQEAEGRYTLLWEELQEMREVCRITHGTLAAMSRKQFNASDFCSRKDFCQWVVGGLSQFAETVTAAVFRLLDEKSRLFLGCGVEFLRRERPGVTDWASLHALRGRSHHRCSGASPAVVAPLRRSVSTEDVTRSMVRYSKMLNEQRRKNDTRLSQFEVLVTQFDDLIERGRAVSQLEMSPRDCLELSMSRGR
ncbi:hypothetical protein, conserved [Trypanosoma cruzi]|uniref:Uncharacterized protein n=1 Tax=Trypanosoma cruzi (strain CL Brener) TaxID=353153 RepID=Q4DFQ6_TRYCC|nr:hypothetical protein, conserved [Trypanosoma cruzi]EAN91345.1 hypothetical protein, conserved [Trypanosoma cruzi]|eukprot:XP_813196.1 hypothetical protein Tc00.1047053509911.10 [Trypanosoma cruzi strain CL Brener]